MSVTVRPDYFQGTCFFDFYSEFESFLGLICDLLPIGDSWSLLGRSLFCGELFTDSFRSIRGKLYGGLRRDNFWYKVLLQIPGSYWSQLESVNRLPLLELLSDQGLNITRFDIALDDYRLIIGGQKI